MAATAKRCRNSRTAMSSGRVPRRGVGVEVSAGSCKWRTAATATSLAAAGHLSIAEAIAVPVRVGRA